MWHDITTLINGGSHGISLCRQSVDKGVDQTSVDVRYIDAKIKQLAGFNLFLVWIFS